MLTADANSGTMINGSTSLINNLNIKQNCKVVYEGNSLIEYSGDDLAHSATMINGSTSLINNLNIK